MNNSKDEDFMNNEEIDIASIFYSLLRNKKLISQITFLSFFIGIFYSLSIKKIWEGNFQIVLSQSKNPLEKTALAKGKINPTLLSLTSLNKNDNLKTEVGILKSPLVLNKIFNYVKISKFSEGKQIPDSFTFKKWKRDSLRVDLEKGTSILNLSYRDENKELILPVLNKISKSYQDFSGRKKSRRIKLEKSFFTNQIESYKERSSNSFRKAQDFAIEQDLSIFQAGDSEIDEEIPAVLNVEAIRIESSNNIKQIDIQLKALKDINDPESLMYLAATIPKLVEQGLPAELDSLEKDIKIKKTIYKNEDKIIKDLLIQRNILINLLKVKIQGYLETRKISEEAILKAAERPKGVLFEYRQLLNNAYKDKITLEGLENQYRAVLLEEAKIEDPWELITTPTLLRNPVYPNKKLVVLYVSLFGIFAGSLIAIFIERRKNLFLTSDSIQKETKIPTIIEINIKKENKIEDSFDLLMKSSYFKNEKNITFLKEDQLDKKLIKIFESKIKSLNYDFKTIDIFLKSGELSSVILMPILGKTTKNKINNDIKNLKLIGVDIIGTISINDQNNLYSETDLFKLIILLFNSFLISKSNFVKYIQFRLNRNYIKSKLTSYRNLLYKESNSRNNKTK